MGVAVEVANLADAEEGEAGGNEKLCALRLTCCFDARGRASVDQSPDEVVHELNYRVSLVRNAFSVVNVEEDHFRGPPNEMKVPTKCEDVGRGGGACEKGRRPGEWRCVAGEMEGSGSDQIAT